MKNNWIIICLISLIVGLPFCSSAQTTTSLDPEVGLRLGIGIDKKLAKGLHLSLEEEMRMDNNFTDFNRLQTTLGLDYKVHKNIKLGLSYAMINPYSSSDKAFKFRHRLMFDITGTLHLGKWNLSLKERFQWTYRAGDINVYQNPRNMLALKSRIMLKYKGSKVVNPYVYVEMRNVLNAPVVSAYYDGSNYLTEDGSTSGDAGWFLTGYNGGYINRVRGCLGVDINIKKHNVLNFYFLADYVHDKVIDANSEGTKLKSYTIENGFVGWLGASYTFKF
ncbi:MAG: DUF2490 domain-containing protein [Bacteroidales bacterium]|nr:DUF2490 domain-containing protein [Bacteroidales bacterium]